MHEACQIPEEADKGEECPGGLRAYEGGPEDGALATVGDLALLPAPRLKLPAHLENRQRFAGASVSDPDSIRSVDPDSDPGGQK